MIEVHNVTKYYDATPVLQGLTFDVQAGERLALIGPSGSGKTTVLRTLMTLETIDSGDIRVEGESICASNTRGKPMPADEDTLRRIRAKIGMVFQLFNLFPHMTVLQNVALAPTLTKIARRGDAEALAMELLGMVGMADKAQQRPAQLSGGQKQRVAIARALALKPKIMLFDEVTSALDPELVEEVLNVLRRLGRETDMTMLLVTHEMSFARDFANRVLFMDGGRIVESGTPDELFCRPREARTQAFLRKIVAAGHRI